MWSWHIWVTDYDISSVIPIMATDVTEQWIPVPLGFCDAETRTSSSTATIHLHIKQAESNKQAIISYNLGTATMSYGNTAPYYEWGRKDPLRPSTGLGNVNKPIYGLYTTPGTISSTAIDVTIRNPHYFNSSNGNTSLELWNVGNTVSSINVNPVIKSIYDPSPAGFRVPCSGATQSWTDSGRSFWQSTIGQQGRYFYQLAPTTGEAYFFPSFGWRSSATKVEAVGTVGYYWKSGPSGSNSGHRLRFESSSIKNDTYARNSGFNVWPVLDD